MKKFLAVFLVLAMALSLAACGGAGTSSSQPAGASSSGTGSSASGVPSGRSRESIQRDLDKAKKLLSDMTKNQERDSSLVDLQIYNGMIQRQEQKIYELEEELRLAE